MKPNRYNIVFIVLLLFHFSILLYLINTFSISYSEALIYYGDEISLLSLITHISTQIFGVNDYALRVPFVLFYIGSAILMYLLTENYFKSNRDRLINLAIFMILPGLNSAALLVNESILVIFFTLLYLYIYKKIPLLGYSLLVVLLFIDNSFAILFLALFFYAISKKNTTLLTVSLLLFGVSMTMYGFDFGGVPQGYFLDTIGKYATIFSPALFIYFFYSIYRIGIKRERDIFWYISASALFVSLLFSLRQNIRIEDFAPFVIISMPIMLKLFIHSLRVRLKEFRTFHYVIARITLIVLIVNFGLFVFNKYLYLVLSKSQNHFAYKYHIVKELSQELIKQNIQNISTNNKALALRLKFYGILNGNEYYLSNVKGENNFRTIKIQYHNKIIKQYYVRKNNIKL